MWPVTCNNYVQAVYRLPIVGSVFSDSHVTSSDRDATINQLQQQPVAKYCSGVYDEIDFCESGQQSAACMSNSIAVNNDYEAIIGDYLKSENSYANTYLALVTDKDCCEDDGHANTLFTVSGCYHHQSL
jgi:hypothetical protein